MRFALHGVIVPIVTPFNQAGELDIAALDPLIDFLVARGVAGLFPAGTTGEGFLLTMSERRSLAEGVVAAAAGRVPVIIQTGAPTTEAALDLTRHAQAVGVDAAALIPPYVYHHSDEALFSHYVAVAEAVPELPILLYNFPAISNNMLHVGLVERIMAAAPNVVGMKDSSGSLETLTRLKAAAGDAFLAFNGGDGQVLMSVAMGLNGCVSGNANVVPELLVALYHTAAAGDMEQARRLQHRVNAVRDLLGDGSDLSLFKQMLGRRGIPVGDVRSPLRRADPATVARHWQALVAMDIDFL